MTRREKVKRNKWEEALADVLEPHGFQYEPEKVEYNIPRTYTPDFVKGDLYVECKGYFRVGDRQKYKAIRDALWKKDKTFVFILYKPSTKVQKGARMTMAEWCDKEDIPWYHSAQDLLEDLL